MEPISTAITAIGSILGGIGSKSAAKKKYELQKKQITTEYGWARDDLLFQTQSLIGQIGGAVGASGIRHSSGSVGEVVGSEFEKHQLRNNRLLEGEKLEIAGAREERRQALKSGDLQIAMGVGGAIAAADQGGLFDSKPPTTTATGGTGPGGTGYYSPRVAVSPLQ
jgi:hypothetical protein